MEKQAKIKIIKLIKKNNLNLLFDKISDRFDIYLPVQDLKNGIIDFMNWEYIASQEMNRNGKKDGEKNYNSRYAMNLIEKTKKSPKFLLFPSSEGLFEFEYKKDLNKPDMVNIELKSSKITSSSSRKKIIFGIKPCDMSAVKMFDLALGVGDKKDPYYLSKRNSTIFISVGCSKIHTDCFCTSVGGHPFDFEQADIGIIELEKVYAIVKLNEDIKWLLEENKNFFEKDSSVDEKYYTEINKIISDSEEKMSSYYNNTTPAEISDSMEKSFDSEIWKENTKKMYKLCSMYLCLPNLCLF